MVEAIRLEEESKVLQVVEEVEEEVKVEQLAPAEEAKAEEIMDTECNICYKVMAEPCTLPCKHTFCVQCLRQYF